MKDDIVDRLNDWEAWLREHFPFDESDSELARQWKERQQSRADMARDAAAEITRLRALFSPHPEDGEAVKALEKIREIIIEHQASELAHGDWLDDMQQIEDIVGRALSKRSEG